MVSVPLLPPLSPLAKGHSHMLTPFQAKAGACHLLKLFEIPRVFLKTNRNIPAFPQYYYSLLLAYLVTEVGTSSLSPVYPKELADDRTNIFPSYQHLSANANLYYTCTCTVSLVPRPEKRAWYTPSAHALTYPYIYRKIICKLTTNTWRT